MDVILSRWVLGAALGVFLLPLACGGGESTAAGPPKTATQEQTAAEPGAPSIAWSEKNRDQRMEWMGLEVLPAMEAAFQQFDAQDFVDFECQTCHGDDMQQVDFKMPNKLYSLPKDNAYQSALEYDPEVTKFMAEVVVPKMAELLDMQPYNPDTGQGFGCFGCHPSY